MSAASSIHITWFSTRLLFVRMVRSVCVWLIVQLARIYSMLARSMHRIPFSISSKVFDEILTHSGRYDKQSLTCVSIILLSAVFDYMLYSSTLLNSSLSIHKKRVVSSPWNFGSLGTHVRD